ncbi:MAG: helix-turn-helix transcriptional regulator [Rhodospirillales bacterium]|jgi:transcriptional regulator with XRE-family HTH domain|nr:helix-turn-helix transcriptional regulator [Rhodospirillales bacterium]MBT4038512.1 helix-turn-helix transcriptional regulator [Rhodospirillales bacterium]MBT4625424.1 helix-turn-helix transcriptional regulator [Rhodospirillales bacterium]MBT5352062.1 helix-turn-helix transcriptional regulator [Rhodospirillales bacterium]MBT5521831.1 helix-turn-helix transcriptional regulator [Rhodospirillales bacterium]
MTKSNSARSEKPRKVRRLPPGTPNPVDIHVGARVRLRRTLLGISQERLGDAVGLTFQQIQKYERGANRIGASRIYELSRILDVPVSFFFEDMPDELETHEGRFSAGLRDKEQGTYEADPLARRETLELVRAYYKITDPKVRKRMFELTKTLAKADLED